MSTAGSERRREGGGRSAESGGQRAEGTGEGHRRRVCTVRVDAMEGGTVRCYGIVRSGRDGCVGVAQSRSVQRVQGCVLHVVVVPVCGRASHLRRAVSLSLNM